MSAIPSTKFSPAWILFFLAPVVGELLPGSLHRLHFSILLPLSFSSRSMEPVLFFCRELAARTGRSWPTILALGAAVYC